MKVDQTDSLLRESNLEREKGGEDNREIPTSKVSSFKAVGVASTAKAEAERSESSDTIECGTSDGPGISKLSGGKSPGPSDAERLSGVTGCGFLPDVLSMSCRKRFRVPWSLCFA